MTSSQPPQRNNTKRYIALGCGALIIAAILCTCGLLIIGSLLPTSETLATQAVPAPTPTPQPTTRPIAATQPPTAVPTPTEPPPTIAPTPGPPQLEILSHTDYVDDIGWFNIIGEIQNNSDTPLQFVKIVATLYDSADQIVGTDYNYTNLDIIPPGGKSPFTISIEQHQGTATYKLQTEGDPAPAPWEAITILTHSHYTDDLNWLHIQGEIQNTSDTPAQFISIIATLYNAQGHVIGADFNYTNLDTVPPGGTSPFEITIDHWPDFDHYQLQTQATPADTSAPPPPPPPAMPTQPMAKITSPTLNVRTGPDTTYPVIGKLNLDDLVEVNGRNAASDWLQINYPPDDNTQAWIAAAYTELTGDLIALPEIAAPPLPTLAMATNTPIPIPTNIPRPTADTGCPPSTWAASKLSDKYHYPDCRHAKKILPENLICFETTEAAQAASYQPCGVCQPP